MKKNEFTHSDITKELLIEEWVKNRMSQQEIADKHHTNLALIEDRIKRFGLTGMRTKIKFPVNEEKLHLDNPILWYLIGLIISDGHIDLVNNRTTISLTNDYEVLEELSKHFSTWPEIPIIRLKTCRGHMRYILILSNKKLVELLRNLGIAVKDKTKNTDFPDPGTKELFNMLFRGYLDGDGNIRRIFTKKKSLEFRYYSHSDKVTEKTVFLFKKYYNVDLYKYSTKGHSGCTVSSPSIGEDILIQIYNDFPSIAIPRKRNIIKGLVDDIVHRYEMINRNNW